MVLLILRALFILVASGLAVVILFLGIIPSDSTYLTWGVFIGVIGIAVGVIAIDMAIRRKHLEVISAIYFGLIVGLFLAYVASLALTPFVSATLFGENTAKVQAAVQLVLAAVLCYTCISLLLQTRSDFRFIIPYVEFSKEVKGRRPYILDTSVVIDGRIADVVEANVFDTQLIMPRFVISELQAIADSSDRLRRSRGRRGLDILNKLRNTPNVEMEIYDRELPEFANQPVDLKLVSLAKHLEGKLVTNDYNLNKVARLQGVSVINLNDLANALKPVFLPGERADVRLVKIGEEPGQGVGYLDDGTMVVVEGGRDHINESVTISVTSVLQTSAGRMVFGRVEAPGRPAEGAPSRAR
ncbi:MAG: PIN/TRAM domain-containing protein [Thermoguttaceae bacterium]